MKTIRCPGFLVQDAAVTGKELVQGFFALGDLLEQEPCE
jgi:hypothetical protein